jgi:hypothetical protein
LTNPYQVVEGDPTVLTRAADRWKRHIELMSTPPNGGRGQGTIED